MEEVLHSSTEMERWAKEVARMLTPKEKALVIALHGELGAGKTTFVQYLVSALGGRERVISPTFVLLKTYHIQNPLFSQVVHIDAYRLSGVEDVKTLALSEYMEEPKNILCIEWAEKISEALPEDRIDIYFSHHEGGRSVSYGQG